MFDRLMNIFKAMFNAGVSKMETPEILAEQAQMELEGSVKKIQEGLTASLTNEKMLDAQLKKSADEKANWERRAALAVQQNNDDVAKQCIQKKVELANQIASQEAQLAEQKKTTADLKKRYGEMEQELKDFHRKKQSMTARAKGSEAVAKANAALTTSGTGTSAMDKWEAKIKSKEIQNEALLEMRGASKEMEQLKDMDKNQQVDDELAMLKIAMSQAPGAGGPKLIVQNPADDAVDAEVIVDENVPMLLDDKDKK